MSASFDHALHNFRAAFAAVEPGESPREADVEAVLQGEHKRRLKEATPPTWAHSHEGSEL